MSAIADYVAERSPTSAAPQPLSEACWAPATRIAFRFCFLYFGLYILTTQMLAGMLPNPKFRVPVLAQKPPMQQLVIWVGNHLLSVKPAVHPTGSGDTLFDWTAAFTLLLLVYGGAEGWKTYGGGAPKSPLYGIWDVDSMSINGELKPPLTTDTLRYNHVVFQSLNGPISFQKMDRKFDRFGSTIDTVKRTLTLQNFTDTTSKPVLAYERPSPTNLALEGDLVGAKRVRMAMTQHDLNNFMLISRGFHWVQEYPVNR
jgi:hypothetical protein